MPTVPLPAASARWNLVISENTNVAVRTFLAQRGFKKGDLSAFVEDAVRWRVFDQVMGQAREGLDALAPQDAESLLEEALSQVRVEGLAAALYDPFKPTTPPMAMESQPAPSGSARKAATVKPKPAPKKLR
ncbi:MAG: ribbon-helix-helix domain-containing protein [Polaromonas sp.]